MTADTVDRKRLAAGFRLAGWTVRPEDGSLAAPESPAVPAIPAITTRLEPQLMSLLVYLAARSGQVVAKRELLAEVWGGRYVSDETLKGCLYQLRKALGDDSRQPRFLETLPKRGVRLLVEPVPLAPAPEAPGDEVEELLRRGSAALAGSADPAALRQARLYYERAAEAAPDSAPALAGLARCYLAQALAQALGGTEPARELLSRCRVAALRAVELEPFAERCGEMEVVLAALRFVLDRELEGAETALRVRLARHPASAEAHLWLTRLLTARGRHAEAVTEARQALALEPLSLAARRALLETLLLGRRYEEALAEAHRLFDLTVSAPDIQLGLVWIHLLLERPEDAFAAFLSGLRALGASSAIEDGVTRTFERGGMPAILALWAERAESEGALGAANDFDRLFLAALLGERERAFERLAEIEKSGHPALLWQQASPLLDPLRADPRFADLALRLGLRAGT